MKRYWKLTTVTMFIVVVIGTLLIQTILATNSYPEFVLEHKSGDQKEVKPLTVIGEYVADDSTYIFTKISNEGTSYQNSQSSYLNFLQEDYLQPEMNRLIKDYRGFMRGKQERPIYLFFEDQNALAHVDLKSEYIFTRDGQWSYSFEVDVLDQKSKNKTSFELAIPEGEKYAYLDIQGVQLINDELIITTVNELNTRTEQYHHAEMHIYTVDLDTKEVVNDEVIDFAIGQMNDDQSMNMYTIDYREDIGPQKYIVSTIEITKETYVNDRYYHYGVLEQQLIAYNLETNEQVRIELPGDYSEEAYPILSSGSTVYFSKEMENQIEIIGYNLEKQAIETTHIFDMPHVEGNLFSQFTLMNDKIYMVQQLYEGKANATIIIGDIQTGETLYEGSVELADSSKDQQVKKMHIYKMHVKKE